MQHYDLIVVGAGIMGLAHAYHASRAGMSVGVFDRNSCATGASVRNFGMLAVLAQSEGKQFNDACRSLDVWQHIAPQAGIDLNRIGCLIVARHHEELTVLQEFAATHSAEGSSHLVKSSDMDRYAIGLSTDTILGGLWSNDAWKVDQRQASMKIADWLQHKYDVAFYFSTAATHIEPRKVATTIGSFSCDTVIVCAGNELSTLFPSEFATSGVTECQLQMLRSEPQPNDWRLKPFILGGLSLSRYASFSNCPGLPALKSMQQSKYADYLQQGIHLIACQESDGSITIGDSHQYAEDIPPERSAEIDRLILNELDSILQLPTPIFNQRWCGRYAHLPDTEILKLHIADHVLAVTMTNGQGMTHAFAQAEDVIDEISS